MKLIVNHEIVKVMFEAGQHRVLIKLSEGGFIEHNPFPGDLRGLVAAMDLARDCIAGKFFPARIVQTKEKKFIDQAIAQIEDMTEGS
jgi:hypothetical protein